MDTPRRQCTATAKSTGRRCGNTPELGATVCRIHGGAAPQVKRAAARRRIEMALGPAVATLITVMEDPKAPHSARVAAAKDILDRGGLKPTERVEVITMDAVAREIERLEAELALLDE